MLNLAKWSDHRETALNNAKHLSECITIFVLFKMAFKAVWRFCKLIVFTINHFSVAVVILSIIISVYGVVVVILAGELEFALNPDTKEEEIVEELDFSGMSEYEKYRAMSEALDLDLVEEYWKKNTNDFKEWYEDYQITSSANETPAMMVDIYLLVDDIYTRPEINDDSYDKIIDRKTLLGAHYLESAIDLPDADRLYDAPLELVVNSAGYSNPLGNKPSIWTSNIPLNSGSDIGCTFISKYENEDIPDEQRSIYGGSGNISHLNAGYISKDRLSRRDDMQKIAESDKAIKYLKDFKLPGTSKVVSRGDTTWIPDTFYTFAYTTRIVAQGMDRGTHVKDDNTYFISGNANALTKMQDDMGLTKEDAGTIASMLYCGDRHFHCQVDALPDSADFDSLDSEIAGTCIVVNSTLFLEGYLDEIAKEYDGKMSGISTMFNISEKIYGECSYSGGVSCVTKVTDDSAFMKCLKKIDIGDTEYDYTKKWLDIYKSMETKATEIHNKIDFSPSERLVRMTYAPICYVCGSVYLQGLENVIDALYNYEDDGKKVFRKYDVDFGDGGSTFDGEVSEYGWASPVPLDVGASISSGYGNPNRDGRCSHFGADISSGGWDGVEYYAVKDATVLYVKTGCTHDYGKSGDCGCTDGYGNSIVLDIGDNTYIRYGHCKDIVVDTGDEVKQGQLIAHAGSTGWSTGAHLHLEVLHPTSKPSIGSTSGMYASGGCPTEKPEKYLAAFFDVSYWYP